MMSLEEGPNFWGPKAYFWSLVLDPTFICVCGCVELELEFVLIFIYFSTGNFILEFFFKCSFHWKNRQRTDGSFRVGSLIVKNPQLRVKNPQLRVKNPQLRVLNPQLRVKNPRLRVNNWRQFRVGSLTRFFDFQTTLVKGQYHVDDSWEPVVKGPYTWPLPT
jgi:hypothetical protein